MNSRKLGKLNTRVLWFFMKGRRIIAVHGIRNGSTPSSFEIRIVCHGLFSAEELERWLVYRDSRNDTAHNYGEEFAEHTLQLIANFKGDALTLYETLRHKHG